MRQQMLAERRRNEEARQGAVRVKVAMSAKKPQPRRKAHCLKCGGEPKPPVGQEGVPPSPPQQQQQQPQVKSRCNNSNKNNKLYMGRFGHFRKPQRLQPKQRRSEDVAVEVKQVEADPELTAPPPPPSPPPSPPACPAKATESLWEQPTEDMPNLVAFAHEVFNRPLHLRKRQPSFYDNLFVSDFIPLDKPITDAAGGAISKRRRIFGRPLRSHCSRPLPPLSQVLSEILAKQKVRAKGGGLAPKEEKPNGSNVATQFSPFEIYEGPSEDALVVDSARLMLRQPKALHIKQRVDLPPTRLPSFESEPSSDCSSSSPFDVPTAPPAERQRHNYSVGAPLRLHEMMKAVAHSGLSDSSASSSSTSSSSHKSVSSTLPVHQQSVRSRGGEEPPHAEEKPAAEPEMLPISIIEKILWLMEQKPPAEPGPTTPLTDDALHHMSLIDKQEEHIENSHKESFKGLLQFMKSLQITETNDSDETRSEILKNDDDEEFKLLDLPMTTTELHQPNDMSNELPLNSTNKSAGDEKYPSQAYSTDNRRAKVERGGLAPKKAGHTSSNGRNSMWSMLGGFFAIERCNEHEESKPLNDVRKLHYGAINSEQTSKELTRSNQSCQKCGLNRRNKKKLMNESRQRKPNSCNGGHKPGCGQLSTTDSSSQIEPNVEHNQVSAQELEPSIIMDRQTIEKEELNMEIAVESAHKTHLKNDPAPFPTPTHSTVTGSTLYESCYGISTPANLPQGPETRNQMLRKLLHKLQENASRRQPRLYHVVKTMATIQYASSEIIKPKMLATSTPRTAQMEQYTLSPTTVKTPAVGIYEFRTPDIQSFELAERKSSAKDVEALFTPVAYTATSSPTAGSSVASKVFEHKKKYNSPVWPAHPFKHRKRSIYFEAVQLKINDSIDKNENQNSINESESKEQQQPKQRRGAYRDTWIVDEVVHQKINEMMTKPIKLLTVNDTAEIQSQ